MNGTILEEILAVTREKVAERQRASDVSELRIAANEIRSQRDRYQLKRAMSRTDRTNIIAEIKRASPSKGVINDKIDVTETAMMYERGGAAAISVLTEEQFFKGSLDDLRKVRKVTGLPLLRKDFIVDEFQIYEAATAGADAILLIVAALTVENLKDFQQLAHDLGLDALVEAHTLDELQIAADIGASLIGVNNRNLRTFEVSIEVSKELIRHRPANGLMIAESGISTRQQINELCGLGYSGFLVGETLMRATNANEMIGELI